VDKVTGYIRPIVIGLFRNGSRILVAEGVDPTKKARFFRPLGGSIEFGETGLQALEREIGEELGQKIERPAFLGVLENLFTYDGEPGHEIVLVFDAQFTDRSLYQCERIPGGESDGAEFDAVWLDLDKDVPGGLPLYPDGLREFIRNHESCRTA
jgi:8-oxo-dGTP pyrophosphatase MutT (NUDIX family)